MTDRTSRPVRARGADHDALSTAPSPTAVAHAQAAKVLTTGVSVSMVLGIVAYMSHSVAVEERVTKEHELQAQLAAAAAQQAAAASSTSVPMVLLADGTLVPGDTLVPGSTPTAAQAASGGTVGAVVGGGTSGSATGTTVAGGSSGSSTGGGTSTGTTQPVTTQPPVTQAPTTTVPVTVAPTTTVSGGTSTSH